MPQRFKSTITANKKAIHTFQNTFLKFLDDSLVNKFHLTSTLQLTFLKVYTLKAHATKTIDKKPTKIEN